MKKPSDNEIVEAIDFIVNTLSVDRQPASFEAIITRLNTKEHGYIKLSTVEQGHVSSKLPVLVKEGRIKAIKGANSELYYTIP